MLLLGLELVLVSYVGLRAYEKTTGKIVSGTALSSTTMPTPPQNNVIKNTKENTLKNTNEPTRGEKNTHLHYVKASSATLGLSVLSSLNPIWLPVTVVGFTYSAVPYLRLVEHSLFEKKKIDGYVLYGIADLMTLGLGHVFTATLGISLTYIAYYLVSNAEERSKNSLIDVFNQQPRTAWLLRDNVEIEVPLTEIHQNDIVVIGTGEIVPVDGIVLAGIAAIDQHTLTGESQPAEKTIGDTVLASTLVLSGCIQVRVLTAGGETAAAKISELLTHSIDFKTHSQLKGEQWADNWSVPFLALGFSALPFLGPTATVVILNGHIAQSIRITAPLSTLNYLNIATHRGLLIKDGRVLEDLPNADAFLFDKTGTLTSDEPIIGRVIIYDTNYPENDVLMMAAAAERKLAHPIARAIVKKAESLNLILPEIEDAHFQVGYGVSVFIGERLIRVGSYRFMQQEGIILPDDSDEDVKQAHAAGHSLVMVACDHRLVAILEMHATLRPEALEIIKKLRERRACILAIVSGDQEQPTQKLAERLGMDHYFYNVLPQNKADIVSHLQQKGYTVCFIGDGVNDTIAMKKANISISLSGATSIATDTAQIVLMDGSLKHLPDLLEIATELEKNLDRSWLFNVIPSTLTVIGAFFWRMDILTSVVLTQGGLGLGLANAALPLQQLKTESPNKQIPHQSYAEFERLSEKE
jgi:heavy metal translocating P-type ATPase